MRIQLLETTMWSIDIYHIQLTLNNE